MFETVAPLTYCQSYALVARPHRGLVAAAPVTLGGTMDAWYSVGRGSTLVLVRPLALLRDAAITSSKIPRDQAPPDQRPTARRRPSVPPTRPHRGPSRCARSSVTHHIGWRPATPDPWIYRKKAKSQDQQQSSSPEQGHHQPRATPPSGRVLHERAGSARRLHWAVTRGGTRERGRLAPVGARGGAALPAAAGRGLDAVRAARVAHVAGRVAGPAAADPDAAVHRRRRGAARTAVVGTVRRDPGGVPRLVARWEGLAARPGDGGGEASTAHARAG